MGFTIEDCFSFFVYCMTLFLSYSGYLLLRYTVRKSTEFCLFSLNLASCYLYKFPSGHRTMGFYAFLNLPNYGTESSEYWIWVIHQDHRKGHQHERATWFEHPVLCPQGQEGVLTLFLACVECRRMVEKHESSRKHGEQLTGVSDHNVGT